MNTKQSIGWCLVVFGIGVIVWGLYASFQVFNGKNVPPQVFKIEQVQSGKLAASPKTDIQKQAEEAIGQLVQEQLQNMLPVDFLPKLFNLISWSIFVWILFMGGGHLAGIGIRLIK